MLLDLPRASYGGSVGYSAGDERKWVYEHASAIADAQGQ